MNKILVASLVCVITLSLSLTAFCETPTTTTVKAVIAQAKTLPTVKAKADYLVSEAKKFYSAKNFKPVVDVCQYVLQNVDKNSVQAKSLLDKAKEQLKIAAQNAVSNVKGKLGNFTR